MCVYVGSDVVCRVLAEVEEVKTQGFSEEVGEMRKTICTCDICKKRFGLTDHKAISLSFNVYDSNHLPWQGDIKLDVCPKCVDRVHKLFNLDYSGVRK